MKSFPTLYKLTSKKQIQQWTIFVNKDEFWTEEGILGGKITKSLPTKCIGKNIGKTNETSPAEQALAEAEAKHQKKLDGQYFLDIATAQGGEKNWYEPMLAFKFEDYKDEIAYPVYSQPKLDGIRCIITAKGMFTRNGKRIVSAPHIFEALKPFFDKDKNAILDGELYCDKLANDFNEICSLVKRTKPTKEELQESAKVIEFWCYDAPRIGLYSESDKFYDRFRIAADLLDKRHKCVKVVPTQLVSNYDQLTYIYEDYLEDGYEGQMVRLNAAYENKRSKSLLKRKEFIDEEYVIVDVVEGEGGRTGTAGHMKFFARNGKPFKSNIKGAFPWLRQLLAEKKSLIGKKATIKYFALTPDGIPRFGFVTSIRDYE